MENSTLDKFKLSYRYIKNVYHELILEIYLHFTSPYPLLLIINAYRRIRLRLRIIWCSKRSPGRPRTSEEIVDLILDMKNSNSHWGSKSIRDALALLGYSIHKSTIQKILKEYGYVSPPTKFSRPTWKAFLSSLAPKWEMDFSCIFDLSGVQIFILSVINYQTRELVLINVTANPTRVWIIQQFKNVSITNHSFPEYLIIDNDGIYGKWIDVLLPEYFGMKICRIPYFSPWFNGAVERFHKTLKTELLFRLPCNSTREIQSVCSQFKEFYNNHRAHQGIDGKIPSKINEVIPLGPMKYKKIKHMNSLFTSYELAA